MSMTANRAHAASAAATALLPPGASRRTTDRAILVGQKTRAPHSLLLSRRGPDPTLHDLVREQVCRQPDLLVGEHRIQQSPLVSGMTRRGQSPRAGGRRLGHQAVAVGMLVAELVAQLMHQDRQEVHAALLTLIAGGDELRVIPRRRVDEPAVAGGVPVEPDG